MVSRRLARFHGLMAAALVLVAFSLAQASDDNRAALVVDLGGGQVVTRCISFSEPQISGLAALQRSGLALEIDYQSGGAAVCRINTTGCSADDCFCQCQGSECVYWSYWHLRDGLWQYSSAGAGLYQLSNGTVDGWVWGPGSVAHASPPPLVTFEDVCLSGPTYTPTASPTPSITPTPIVVVIDTPSGQLPATAAPTSPPTATSALAPTQPPAAAATPPTPELAPPTAALPTASPQPTELPVLPPIGSTPAASETAVPIATTVPVTDVVQAPVISPEPSPIVPMTDVNSAPTVASIVAIDGQPVAPEAATAMTTPNTLAVVGAGSAGDAAGADSAIVASPEGAGAQADNAPVIWASYLGFLGIILLLGALALIGRLRRDSRQSSS